MARRKSEGRDERIQKRNKAIEKRFNDLVKNNPKWRIDAVVKDVADEFFLSPNTVYAIINGYYMKKDQGNL